MLVLRVIMSDTTSCMINYAVGIVENGQVQRTSHILPHGAPSASSSSPVHGRLSSYKLHPVPTKHNSINYAQAQVVPRGDGDARMDSMPKPPAVFTKKSGWRGNLKPRQKAGLKVLWCAFAFEGSRGWRAPVTGRTYVGGVRHSRAVVA